METMTEKEQQEKRDDFYKRIDELCGDANDLWERIDELKSELDEYLTDLEEDEEDKKLQEALHFINYAVDEIGEGSHHVDWAYWSLRHG